MIFGTFSLLLDTPARVRDGKACPKWRKKRGKYKGNAGQAGLGPDAFFLYF